jgi:hypothetical protein
MKLNDRAKIASPLTVEYDNVHVFYYESSA